MTKTVMRQLRSETESTHAFGSAKPLKRNGPAERWSGDCQGAELPLMTR